MLSLFYNFAAGFLVTAQAAPEAVDAFPREEVAVGDERDPDGALQGPGVLYYNTITYNVL